MLFHFIPSKSIKMVARKEIPCDRKKHTYSQRAYHAIESAKRISTFLRNGTTNKRHIAVNYDHARYILAGNVNHLFTSFLYCVFHLIIFVSVFQVLQNKNAMAFTIAFFIVIRLIFGSFLCGLLVSKRFDLLLGLFDKLFH